MKNEEVMRNEGEYKSSLSETKNRKERLLGYHNVMIRIKF